MSTKTTLAYGDTFHFYQEVLDEHYVYLELQGVKYEANYNRVMVPIPIHTWEVIRKLGAPNLSLVGKQYFLVKRKTGKLKVLPKSVGLYQCNLRNFRCSHRELNRGKC